MALEPSSLACVDVVQGVVAEAAGEDQVLVEEESQLPSPLCFLWSPDTPLSEPDCLLHESPDEPFWFHDDPSPEDCLFQLSPLALESALELLWLSLEALLSLDEPALEPVMDLTMPDTPSPTAPTTLEAAD